MKILCDVDQAECFRHGVDAPKSTVMLEVDPKTLTEEQRNFIADELRDGVRFPSHDRYAIAPPTYEGFILAVHYGIACDKLPKDDWGDGEEKLKQARQNLIKAEVEKMEKREVAKA